MNPLVVKGISKMFGAARRGDQRALFSGFALLAWALWRRGRQEQLIHSATIRRGQSLLITNETSDVKVVRER